ncbi:MAG: D-2-hydroxyacid dehydrogenase [Bacillota bacterium]|nr:D-2-hydroxyacid dehydrogenase [Bacillota bacterium]
MSASKPPVLVHHPQDTLEYARLASAALPGVDLVPCLSGAEMEALMPEVEIIFGWRIPGACFRLARRLQWLQGMGAGVEDLLANKDLPARVKITRVTGIFGPWIAEYTLAHALAWTQDIRRSLGSQAVRKWDKYLVRKLRGLRLGVAGLGSVGQEVARLAAAAGLRVTGFDLEPRRLPGGGAAYCGDRGSPSLLRFLSELDILSVNLPLTRDTDGMFGAAELAALPAGALVVNTARGRIIDQHALIEALRSGHLGGAALDVFETEPLPEDSPLWSFPQVAVTAHISGPSTPAEVVPIFLDNYRRYHAGEPLAGLVDRVRGF